MNKNDLKEACDCLEGIAAKRGATDGGPGSGPRPGGGSSYANHSNEELREHFGKAVGSGNSAKAAEVRAEQERRAKATTYTPEKRVIKPQKTPKFPFR